MATHPPTRTAITLPQWIWGGTPARFLEMARLHVISDPSLAADEYRVKTLERSTGNRPGLVTVRQLAGPPLSGTDYGSLDSAETEGSAAQVDVARRHKTHLRLERAELFADKSGAAGFVAPGLSLHQLQTTMSAPGALAETVQLIVDDISSVEFSDGERAFPNTGAFYIRRDPALVHRATIPPILVRVAHDGTLQRADLNEIKAASRRGEAIFAASSKLSDGMALLDGFLAPLLGALTPYVWAFSATRRSGSIVYTLGEAISGTAGDAVEPLHLLPSQGALAAAPRPALSARAASAAVLWWTQRLDKALSVVSDPTVFSSSSGRYLPNNHQHAILSFDQLFRRVGAIQRSHRDDDARRVLLFTVLDTLERLTDRRLTDMCMLAFAQRTLDRVRGDIPADAAEVLLPAAERAVLALGKVQDGFYLRRQTGASTIDFVLTDGTPERYTPEEAAAEYIRVLRNATHGHGSNRNDAVPRTDALLAHHDGSLDHDLPLLGYLYLLDLVSKPALLRRVLSTSVKD